MFTVSVVRQRNEYEIVTETRPIEYITSSPFQDVNLHKKIMKIAPWSDEIKYT